MRVNLTALVGPKDLELKGMGRLTEGKWGKVKQTHDKTMAIKSRQAPGQRIHTIKSITPTAL